jgi:DNA invertase Pin-like site-specific DNA recombinase
MIVGYARVRTDGQSLERQQSAPRQAGATQVFAEKISGGSDGQEGTGKSNRRACDETR